jgi:hypothetical protein
MRYLIFLILIVKTTSVTGQVLEEWEKAQLFKTSDGRLHSRRFADSIQFRSINFGTRTKFKETRDSIYYILKYFPKSEFPDRYVKEGTFCGNSERKKLKEIQKLSPFNETYVVKLVSFKQPDNGDDEMKEREIPKTDNKIDFKRMHEIKTLDRDLTDKLLDILVNYDNDHNSMDIAFCYEPRNGIVFVDKSDRVLGYIEICFDCQQFKIEPKTLPISPFCNEKLDVIQGIFMKSGITYGMIRGVD